MSRFLQLHLLTSYAAANLNRDDTGRPKTLHFGDAERLRVSSQSLKRAFRVSDVFHKALPDALGKRSQGFAQGLIDALVAHGLSPEDAVARAESVIERDHLGKVKDKGKGSARTEQLVHLAPEEIAAITALADRLKDAPLDDEKTVLTLKDKPRAADIAMFGRMLADNPGYNVDAAVQVAHAFTTHRVVVEDDYYTAVDDIKNADAEADRGAGFIGVQHYGAGLFYLYVCVDGDLLLDNLAADKALARDTIGALVEAAATVSPTGKQNSYGSRAKADYALLEIGDDAPRSLASAFQNPVKATPDEGDDIKKTSIKRLQELREGFEHAYGEKFKPYEMEVGKPGGLTLADLIAAARDAFKD